MSLKKKTIEVVTYNSMWPKMYEAESSLIRQAIGDNCIEVYHVGSTSVPGLDAKPIIDIILVVKNPTHSIAPLESIGYTYKGEVNIPFRFYFSKEEGQIPVHLHVYEAGNSEIVLNLLFRNFLRTHREACVDYAKLKDELVIEQKIHKDARPMFSHYTLGKNSFIRTILEQAGFNELRIMHCTHYAEWEAAKTFRQKYFFDNVPISDPYTWTFNHPDHNHFVLYKGTEIIGYVHLQRWSDHRAAIRIMVIDEPFRNHTFGSKLLALCERWLKSQGFKSVHAQAAQKALKFYRQHGYAEMPFNDPDGYESDPRDIAVGKTL